MNMKKWLVVVMMAYSSVVVRADMSNDVAAAKALYAAGDYPGSVSAFQAVLSSYPSAPSNVVCSVNMAIGMAQHRLGNWSGAVAAFDAAVTANESCTYQVAFLKANTVINGAREYKKGRDTVEALLASNPNGSTVERAQLHNLVGRSYVGQEKWVQAATAYGLTLSNASLSAGASRNTRIIRGEALTQLGKVWAEAGRKDLAAEAYMGYVKELAPFLGASNETSAVWTVFDKIDATQMTEKDYVTFLQQVIRSVRATEGNARFLGMLKSELGKMKQ